MSKIFEPLYAVFAIFAPLGLAYVIMIWQSRHTAVACGQLSVITRDDALPE